MTENEQQRIIKLEQLLQFALDELTYLEAERREDSEYDFCRSCSQPEYDHKKGCEAVQWEKDATKLLAV